MTKKNKISIPNWSKVASGAFFLLLLGAYTQIFAIASPYDPGATLDPECAPGEANCTVNIGGGDTTWLTGEGGISYLNGRVGIGIDSPTSGLTVKGNYSTTGAELITNGTFTGSATGWEINDGTYNDNKVIETYTNDIVNEYPAATTDFLTESGKTYIISFTLSNVINDSVFTYFYENGFYNDVQYKNGTHTIIFTADFTGTETIVFESWEYNDNSTWTIDDVSIKELSSSSSSFNILDQGGNNLLTLGDNYFGNFFVGLSAGSGVSGDGLTDYVWHSTFIGNEAGAYATNARESIFIGRSAGKSATGALNSVFIGDSAGEDASSASSSIFLGSNSGNNATNANSSYFFGSSSGYNATNASSSLFIGQASGRSATNASYSNFIGSYSGEGATSARDSNFIGTNSGYHATNAARSIMIGYRAGYNDNVNTTADTVNDFAILIGNNTRTGGFKNSIALGGSAVNTAENQFMIGSTTRPINTTRWNGSASTQCTLTTGTGIACTSDENLKTNINDLDNTILEKLLNVRTVTFNWKEGDTDNLNIGYLAQDLEKYFPELVATDKDGYKSVYYANMTPILTEAIRELNLKVEDLENNSIGWISNVSNRLSDTGNNIGEFVAGILRAKEKLCIGEGSEEVCITKEELLEIKKNAGLYHEPVIEEPVVEEPIIEEPIVEGDKDLEPQIENEPIVEEKPIITPDVDDEDINDNSVAEEQNNSEAPVEKVESLETDEEDESENII